MPSDCKQQIPPRPELLAPAGNRDCLEAAVKNGADAVYLGVREFNARLYARNFSLEELGQAIDYCHSRGVKVYLTLNTLVKNHEVKRFFNVLSRAYVLGINGVIIQHISFLDIIKSNFPGLAVFISTQGAIGNASSASLVKSADRIILPRELSLAEIKRIIDSGVTVEVFVHGALCFSYSGLCLFSSMVGNRSGNRGDCAQLCRQKYNGAYPLSTKELCLVRRIPELIEAGISGFKIEGRMRSPLYVAVATRLYRKAIDSALAGKFAVPQKELAEIEVVFNREFTEGFAFGEMEIVSPERPMNRGALLGVIEGSEIVLQRPVAVGDGVGIWGRDTVTGAVIQDMTAGERQVDSAVAGEKVSLGIGAKDGTKIYLTSSPQISSEPDFTINRPPVAVPKRKRVNVVLPGIVPRRAPAWKLMVKVYSLAEARDAARAGADIVFYNIFAPDFPGRDGWQETAVLGAYLPRILNDAQLNQSLALLQAKQPGAVLAGNLGFLPYRDEFTAPVYVDYNLNAFNDLDRLFFQKYQVTPVMSPELSLHEVAGLQNKDVVILAHGDMVLVNSQIEIKDSELVDDKGLVFPVRKEARYWQVLNSRPFGLFGDIRKLIGMGFSQFFIDKSGEGTRFVPLYRDMMAKDIPDRRLRKGYTSGHLYRPLS